MNSFVKHAPSRSACSRLLFFAVPLLIEARFSLPALLLMLIFQFCGPLRNSSAQQPKAGSNWTNVEALPPGTKIDLKTRTEHIHCAITSVNEVVLNCAKGSSAPLMVGRPDVLSIRIGHRTRSALIGGGVGGGALAIAGFAVTTGGSNNDLFGKNFLRGQVTAASLGIGAVIGGGIGALTDFSKSTIYKAQ